MRISGTLIPIVYVAQERQKLSLMLWASSLTMRFVPQTKLAVTPFILNKLCKLCLSQGATGAVLRLAIILAFFAFLRASNLCPYKETDFDPTRHLTRGDLQVAPPGIVLQLKWSKTLQQAMQPKCIPVVQIKDSAMDAVHALNEMELMIPAHRDDPLLLLPNGKCLTVPKLRKAFAVLVSKAGLSKNQYSLHSLRRGGASSSYKNGASFIDIKRQGTWMGPTFFDYISQPIMQESTVCSALSKATRALVTA